MATSTEAKASTSVLIPEGVGVKLEENTLIVSGPLGRVVKDFSKVPIRISIADSEVRIEAQGRRKKDLATLNTVRSIISGMVTGVTKGYTYRLKIVYAHFPMSIKVKGDEVYIENYYGERAPRVAKIVGDCQVGVEGDDVVVKGVSKEDVGQTAANIEQACLLYTSPSPRD